MTKEEILLEVLNEHGDFENVSSQFNENDLACILEAMKRYKGQSLPIDSVVLQSEQLKHMVFYLANRLAIAGKGDEAVSMHRIHNRL